MAKTIEHEAVVKAKEDNVLDVEMVVSSACVSCKAKAACGMSEEEHKIMRFEVNDPDSFALGDKVVVYIERVMGMKAVIYSYILPFFVILATLLVLQNIGLRAEIKDLVSGCAALGAGGLYYLILFFCRDHIDRDLRFMVRPAFDSDETASEGQCNSVEKDKP